MTEHKNIAEHNTNSGNIINLKIIKVPFKSQSYLQDKNKFII
jgi:hypothetical protein